VDLSAEKEPQIFAAIRKGALLENICLEGNSNKVDFTNTSKTENTRVAYTLDFVQGAILPSIADAPFACLSL